MPQTDSPPPSTLLVDPSPVTVPPAWLAPTLVLAQLWQSSGLLSAFTSTVRINRGRSGRFDSQDFFLLMLAYAASPLRSFRAFHQRLFPFAPALAAVWQRAALPSPSALSRFLTDIDAPALLALRTLLFEDLLERGLQGADIGGLQDRQGQLHIIFDADPSVEPVRQRAVVQSPDRPAVRRRRALGAAPGYSGRKRGEVQRSRLTLQQAHTSEWLGSWGSPGNGDRWAGLETAAQAVVRYMQARGQSPHQAVVRLDGAYGWAWTPFILHTRHNLGYITRCVDYRLLRRRAVRETLKTQPPTPFHQADTGVLREVFDIGPVSWEAAQDPDVKAITRLIVTRRAVSLHETEVAVGKKRGRWIYEMFVTDRTPEALTAADVVGLYFGRGGFEGQLHHEDEEVDPGRWLSHHPEGQEAFTLLCQHVWNVRLRLGRLEEADGPRQTLWAASASSPPVAEPPPLREDVRCLEGRLLIPTGATRAGRAWYLAPTEFCRICPQGVECMHTHYHTPSGQPVGLFTGRLLSEGYTTRPQAGGNAVMWLDWPGRQLRNHWWRQLQTQLLDLVEKPAIEPTPPSHPAPFTRDQRAHRRKSWVERQQLNRRTNRTSTWRITLHGISKQISNFVGIPVRLAH